MSEELCPICNKGKLATVKKEDNVEIKEFSCGHKRFLVLHEEKVRTFDSICYIKIPDPISLLQDIIKRKDWFTGLIMSATFFEHFGISRLKEYFHSKGINIGSDRIERLDLGEIIMFLYGCGLIDQPTYTKMFEIKKKRDELVHQKKEMPIFEIKEKEGENLVKNAIECLENLVK
jgi:hypothetical protein